MLEHKELANAKLLVFANKQDLKDAMSSSEVARALNLQKIKSHDWNIQVGIIIDDYNTKRHVVHSLEVDY